MGTIWYIEDVLFWTGFKICVYRKFKMYVIKELLAVNFFNP